MRTILATVTTAAVLLGLSISSAAADEVDPPATPEPAPTSMLVIGDSITSGSSVAWLNVVATNMSATLSNFSSSGSGMLKASHHCAPNGTVYGQRLGNITTGRPTFVVVEDGINDRFYCRKGKYTAATDAQVKANIDTFMRNLTVTSLRAGLERDHVIVVLPWGQKNRKYQWLRDHAKRAVARHGLTYIDPYLTVNQTKDGIHPNAAGQNHLANILTTVMTNVSL